DRGAFATDGQVVFSHVVAGAYDPPADDENHAAANPANGLPLLDNAADGLNLRDRQAHETDDRSVANRPAFADKSPGGRDGMRTGRVHDPETGPMRVVPVPAVVNLRAGEPCCGELPEDAALVAREPVRIPGVVEASTVAVGRLAEVARHTALSPNERENVVRTQFVAKPCRAMCNRHRF